MYADDTQLYLSIEPANISVLINNLEKCISEVKDQMFNNKFKLNDDKMNLYYVILDLMMFRFH